MNQSKNDRFKRVAAPRVQRVLDAIESLEKCSHRGNYEYDSDDVKKMIAAIRASVRRLEQSFGSGGTSTKQQFNF